jgi:hypothetical protein
MTVNGDVLVLRGIISVFFIEKSALVVIVLWLWIVLDVVSLVTI